MKLSKFNLVTAITATAFVSGALILPTVWSSVSHNPTSTQLNNNSNIQNTQKTKSLTNLQVVNSVDEIVVEDVGIISEYGYAIVKNNGIQEVYAWGRNNVGQLGVGDRLNKPSPTKVLLPIFDTDTVIKSISFNDNSSHALLERNDVKELYVWGWNSMGELGLGRAITLVIPTSFPLSIFGNGVLREIVFNYHSSYAIIDRTNNQTDIYVWGNNAYGQLGLGDQNTRFSPVLLPLSTTLYGWNLKNTGISSLYGGYSAYALYEKDGISRLYTWGWNGYGQLGLGNETTMTTPQQIPSSRFNNGRIISFGIESEYMCWILVEVNGIKILYTCGKNNEGQLGLNSTSRASVPSPIPTNAFANGEIVDVGGYGTGGHNMYAIVNVNGTLRIYTWGSNEFGGIGNNDSDNVLSPYAIPTTRFNNGSIESYSFGWHNAMVVVRVGNEQQVFVWGRNGDGYLGLNSTTNILIPTRLNSPSFNESSIALPVISRTHMNNTMFSLQKDGKTSYYISGLNDYGQFGNGTTTNKSVHTQFLPSIFTNPIANETEEAIELKSNISASDAMRVINAKDVVSKTELAKYVDLTSFPADALLSIDTDKTKINHEQGTIDLVINSNKYYDQLIVPVKTVPLISLKEYKVSITGFKQVKDININPVTAKTKLTNDINNVDNILKPLVDENNEIKPFIDENNTIINPNRMILEQYLDLSAIPLDATIVLNWTVDKQSNNISIDFKSNHVYNNNGLTIRDENYITNFLFKMSSLDIALIAILVGTGLVALVISLIVFYKIRTNKKQSIIGD